MFPLLEEFRGFRIERRAPGFEFTPGLLGKITTYVVVPPEGGVAIFAFMYSFLVTGGPDIDEEALTRRALATVKSAINVGEATAGSERTYELAGTAWHEVPAPRWWVSVVKPS